MDFLEIRRKAKERAEARARAAVARPEPDGEDGPSVDARVTKTRSEAPEPPESPAPSARIDLPEPDLARLQPLEAVVQAVLAGGELTPVPDLPPWGEALALTPERGAARLGAASTGDGLAEKDWSASAPLWGAAPALAATPATAAGASLDPLDEFFYREDETAPGLTDLDFAAPAQPAPVEVVDPQREYLTFLLGEEEYAIEIERVREVLKAPAITDVPRAPRHVLGVIMVRGEVIAVFDPRRRLGLPEVDRTGAPRVLVCDDGLGSIGLLVDAVSQVVRLRRSDIEARPQGIGGVSAEYISGIGRQSGRLFIVLDLPVVLRGKSAAGAEARP